MDNDQEPNEDPGPTIATYHASKLIRPLWVLFGVVAVLGIFREIMIYSIGVETALKDLRHFAYDSERSLPSWYENLSFAFAAVLLAICGKLAMQNDQRNVKHWFILAIIFFLMSIDAAVSFHEISVKPLRNAFQLEGVFYYSWVLIAAPITLLVGLFYLPFLWRLPRGTAIGFVVAGSIFVGGALGTELLAGSIATTSGLESLTYRFVAALQEFMESLGLTKFISILLKHLAAKRVGMVLVA